MLKGADKMRRYIAAVAVLICALGLILLSQTAAEDTGPWESEWEEYAEYITVGGAAYSPAGKPLNVYAGPGTQYRVVCQLDNGEQLWHYRRYKGWADISFDMNGDRGFGYIPCDQIITSYLDEYPSDGPGLGAWEGHWTALMDGHRAELDITISAGINVTISFNDGYRFKGKAEENDPWSLAFYTPEFKAVLYMERTADAITLGNVECRDNKLGDMLGEVFYGNPMYTRSLGKPGNLPVSGYKSIVFEDDGTPRKKEYRIRFSTDMFLKDSTEFQPEIAKLAVLLASNAYNVDEDNHPGVQIVDMYHALDIDDSHIMLFNYQGHELNVRDDPISADMDEFSIASRGMGDYELLLITMRGSGQLFKSPDWLRNTDAESRESMNAWVNSGFYFYMLKVYDGLSRYMWEHSEIGLAMKEDRLKVLITGHSRGGAAANLLGAFLMDAMFKTDSPIYTAGMDDTFVYTFACPRTMHEKDGNDPNKTSCKNIFNIVINFDPVPKLPKDLWFRWKRYGRTYTYETTYNNAINNYPTHHKQHNYIQAVFDHERIKEQEDYIGGVVVSSDP